MDERGWGWTASETRRAQLIEWIVQRSAEQPDGVYVPVDSFYRALPDQSMNTYVTALDDVSSLKQRSLLELANSFGGVESLQALATPEGRAFAEELQAARSNKQRRRSACRDAMVDWLYSHDAVNPPGVVRDLMLDDHQRGYFFAEPFTADDLDAAAAWLHRQGLVGGAMVEEFEGPVRLYLTDTGVKCAEDFDSDTGGYLERQQYLVIGEPTGGKRLGLTSQRENPELRSKIGGNAAYATNRKAVMVVYGHDKEANKAMFDWLRSIGLQPKEWSQLIQSSGSASPYIGQVLERAFKDAQAIVAFFTPDEFVVERGADRTNEDAWRSQARPNVLIEAGMALVTHPERTVLVVLGSQELPSDLSGRHYIELDGTAGPLNELANRLQDAGCELDRTGTQWLDASRFPDRSTITAAPESGSPGALASDEALAALRDKLSGYR